MATHTYVQYVLTVSMLLVFCVGVGCQPVEPVNLEAEEEIISPFFIKGQENATAYLAGEITDFEFVAVLYELNTSEREHFLDGVVQSLQDADRQADAVTYRQILEEAVRGNQFSRASDMGSKHALQAVNNEQIQGVIHSSLGVSRGVVLGWKAGYIKGFSAQRIAQTTAKGSVDESVIQKLRAEAAATYYALRSAIGR